MNGPAIQGIACTPVPNCYLCGDPGVPLYDKLRDRLFGVPGSWNLKRCRHPECSLVWLDPMPTQEDIGKAYETYYTHTSPGPNPCGRIRHLLRSASRFISSGYLDGRYGYVTARYPGQKALGLLLFLFPPRRLSVDRQVLGLKALSGGRLLDIGCGSGALLARFQNLGWQVEGIDVDAAAVAQARLKGLSVRCGTLGEHHYPDNHFDVITLAHVMEHLHDPLGLLRKCHRILKRGGQLVATTPNLNSLGHKLFKQSWMPLDPPRHLYIFSRPALEDLLRRAGYSVLSSYSSAGGSGFIAPASRTIASTGVFHMDSNLGIQDRLFAQAFFWLEWALLKFRPDIGEELYLVGEK
jgi:SAM-dependent methyltransferase